MYFSHSVNIHFKNDNEYFIDIKILKQSSSRTLLIH